MPFVQRAIEPKYLSRTSLRGSDGKPLVSDQELQAVTNCTLSNALKQLASLVILANDIFGELRIQLDGVAQRSQVLQGKINNVTARVELYDPKKVTVPEGNLSDFAERKVHYKGTQLLGTSFFLPETRPQCVIDLYEAAVKAPIITGHSLNSWRQQSKDLGELLCTPVLSAKRRKLRQKIDVDIETRIPAVIADLRKWTSSEAIGEITTLPDASTRIAANITLAIPEDVIDSNGVGSGDDEPIDHKLPSPEEQLQVIISKFAPELVPIDTSGRFFDRMCNSRRSLLHVEMSTDQNKENIDSETVKRRTRPRKARGKRRNTISGTDQKELREAIAGDASNTLDSPERSDSGAVIRSQSSDLLKKSPIDPLIKKQSHFNTLKQWGKSRLKMISRSPSDSRDHSRDKIKIDKANISAPNASVQDIDDINIYETVTMRRRKNFGRNHEHKILQTRRSDKSLAVNIPVPLATAPVKLRETACHRRQRRSENHKDEPHSSSGNWSASSESGRTSIGSEITTTTIPPKSTTSAGTSSNSLNIHSHGPPSSIVSRRRFLNTSGSSSVTSDGTLTPDIIHDLHEDLETSSEYSCDTEGYYTSFHMDSGLKTLKEEEILMPSTPLHTINTLSSSGNQSSTAENDYELFGKGSTSTTTSSAGTVCTTLMAADSNRSLIIGPVVPERKSSLSKINKNRSYLSNGSSSFDRNSTFRSEKITQSKNLSCNSLEIRSNANVNADEFKQTTAIIHSVNDINCQNICGTESPDSGHNTSSSPIDDSVSSPQGKNSCSEQDFSESSDLEGVDRIERLRVKTTINSSRIPSICVITPANSDDEGIIHATQKSKRTNVVDNPKDKVMRPKLELPAVETDLDTNVTNTKQKTTKESDTVSKTSDDRKNIPFIKNSLLPLNNLMCKLKGVLPHKLSKKQLTNKENTQDVNEMLYSDIGDYVTIADVRNNNKKMDFHKDNIGMYYSNDVVKRNLQDILSGKLRETEYVSLNELPSTISDNKDLQSEQCNILETEELATFQRHGGAKVTLDAEGKVIYSSDSIRRRKGAHTTFEPGPFVKDKSDNPSSVSPKLASPVLIRHEPEVKNISETEDIAQPSQRSKVIIKASNSPYGRSVTEVVKLPPATIIKATPVNETEASTVPIKADMKIPNVNLASPTAIRGAFVNIQETDGVSLSPTKMNQQDYRHSTADPSYLNMHRKTNQYPNPWSQYVNKTAQRMNVTPNLPTPSASVRSIQNNTPTIPFTQYEGISLSPEYSQSEQKASYYEASKTSPISPKDLRPFFSSTPSKESDDRDASLNLVPKLLSPVKSTMTNEELYAVIYKSKRKMNIKDAQVERAGSPALSASSLSPGNSETAITRPIVRLPETGYLTGPRNRIQNPITYEPQEQHKPTISQTSRMDFKKLLLQRGVKLSSLNPTKTPPKISAVEQLKQSKEKVKPQSADAQHSSPKILDLSGSPKTFLNRKAMRNIPAVTPVSPSRLNNLAKEHKVAPKVLLSPKQQWRFSSPRSDVLSSPIPEVNNEDDSPNSSNEKFEKLMRSTHNPPIFPMRRALIPMIQVSTNEYRHFQDGVSAHTPINTFNPIVSRADYIRAQKERFLNQQPPQDNLQPRRTTPSPPTLETAL